MNRELELMLKAAMGYIDDTHHCSSCRHLQVSEYSPFCGYNNVALMPVKENGSCERWEGMN